MYVAILGAGRVGLTLASRLLESGSEIVVIDRDKEQTELLNQALGKVGIVGDARQSLQELNKFVELLKN